MIRYTKAESGEVVEVPHPLHGYEADPAWESEEVDLDVIENSVEDPFGGFTVAELDAVISATDMPVDKKLKKAPKAVAILAALVGVVKADD